MSPTRPLVWTSLALYNVHHLSAQQTRHRSQFLVYRIYIFLLIVILVFATFNTPRAIARFSRRSEWFQGYLLRSVTLKRKPRIDLNTSPIYLTSDPQKTVLDPGGGICKLSDIFLPKRHTMRKHSLLVPFPLYNRHGTYQCFPP